MTKRKGKPTNVGVNISLPRDLTTLVRELLETLVFPHSRDRIVTAKTACKFTDEGDFWNFLDSRKIRLLEKSVWSKYVSKTTLPARERKDAAISKWLLAEMRNVKTNARISSTVTSWKKYDGTEDRFSSEDLVQRARGFIRQTIGETYHPDILLEGAFTNGASTRIKRDAVARAMKYLGRQHATSDVVDLIPLLVRGFPQWKVENPELDNPVIQEHSVMFTVPKSAEIDRVACKEPEINMFLQRAVGLSIRRSLKRKGINLLSQAANQHLAKAGSADNSLATIDLSSASDTISTALVRALLPADWFALLDCLRTKKTLIDGVEHNMNMFSSMGNGFTFELETLIFWALARAYCSFRKISGRISVYGDDIILPSSVAPGFIGVLAFFGFLPNTRKSFIGLDQWERESCGKHYIFGQDVTPFYIRRPIDNQVELIHFLNQYRKWATNGDSTLLYRTPRHDIENVWRTLAQFVDPRVYGGRDPSETGCLVSPGIPKHRLVPMTSRRRNVQKGSYLFWLHTRNELEFESSNVSSSSSRYILRKNRDWAWQIPNELKFPFEM